VLYLGHFWFRGYEPRIKTEPVPEGWFTLLVEAESIEESEEKFREYMTDLKGWFSSFESIAKVYQRDTTEIRELPSQGVLAYYCEFPETDPRDGMLARSLPGVPEEFCVSYRWTSHSAISCIEKGEEPVVREEPFADFEEEDELLDLPELEIVWLNDEQ
jgi:hypothetical protein